MPGYIMHLAFATALLDNWEQSGNAHGLSDMWKRQFLFGNLLPDSLTGEQKKVTHFWSEKDMNKVTIGPDIAAFQDKYRKEMREWRQHPLLLGYFTHLYLDMDFFTNFLYEQVDFLNESGVSTCILSEIDTVEIKKNQKKISLQEFFSEKYLYGDYTSLNRYFIDKYHIKIPEKPKELTDVIDEIKNANLDLVIQKLQYFINESRNARNFLEVFESKDSLDRYLSILLVNQVKQVLVMKVD